MNCRGIQCGYMYISLKRTYLLFWMGDGFFLPCLIDVYILLRVVKKYDRAKVRLRWDSNPQPLNHIASECLEVQCAIHCATEPPVALGG